MESITSIQKHLIQAINDYPKLNLSTSEELLEELYKEVCSPITFESLKRYADTIDLSINSWEAESLASLLLLFKGNETKSLEEIIAIIEKQ
ncbi:MAG: hypothetical protein H6549_08360 [Chitinophagales bacterium]|nr:hypothetical protein [Chitinophagales bacterium]